MKLEPLTTILILGGTAEAVSLAKTLNRQPQNRVINSLAGLTKNHAILDGEVRIGGFGGVGGMTSYLAKECVDEVIDATHPFAIQISSNAIKACKLAEIPIKRHCPPTLEPNAG